MLRYYAAAAALKLFDLNSLTRAAYRQLGNGVWAVRGPRLTEGNIRAARAMLARLRRLGLLDGRPLRALEIGTGWMHFYGIVLALVAEEAQVDLYDVWDNRQLNRLRRTFALLSGHLADLELSPEELARASRRIPDIARSQSLEDLYRRLGLRYFVDPGGELAPLNTGDYDLAFSFDVLEHIRNASVASAVGGIRRVLKSGGISLHEIGLEDHLAHYDRRAAHKQYLAYGEDDFKRWFDNGIQHMNLVGADEWRRLFTAAGFEELEFVPRGGAGNLAGLVVHPRFRSQSRESLIASRLDIVHRKPA